MSAPMQQLFQGGGSGSGGGGGGGGGGFGGQGGDAAATRRRRGQRRGRRRAEAAAPQGQPTDELLAQAAGKTGAGDDGILDDDGSEAWERLVNGITRTAPTSPSASSTAHRRPRRRTLAAAVVGAGHPPWRTRRR